MENNSKESPKEEAVDITKIYEIIRDKTFIQDLWLDVMSDLKQKPSYVHLKSMVEKVIETSVNNYATKPKDHTEKLKTRTTFTDLGIMAYTIDTLISDVLKKKLKAELTSMVSRVIEDCNHKRSLANVDNKTKAVIMLEDIGKLLCNGENDDDEELPDSSDSPGPSKRRFSEKTVSTQPATKKESRLNNIEKETSLLKNGNLSMTCSNIINSKSKSPSKRLQYKGKKSDAISDDENCDVDIMKVSDDEDDNNSIRSVSSVHTSDLSSFEDDISISSEDENGRKVKKRVSLQLAKDLYNRGRLSELHKIQQTEEQVLSGSSETQLVDSPNQRSSTRMRKLNSKYASDDVVCPMKLILSPGDVSDKEAKEDVMSIYSNEMQQSPNRNLAVKKREKNPKRLKSSMNNKNSSQGSESSSESDNSLPSLSDDFKNKKQTAAKRGRPRKDKLLTEQTSPALEQIRKETKAKRGRPSKSSNEEPVPTKKLCVLDDMLPNLEKKLELQNVAAHQTAQNIAQLNDKDNDPEIKRKRGRPLNSNSSKQIPDDEPIQHSVESFSKLEERLCLKDKIPSSPSKSTKSYDTSDLYKPRSDFRIFNSSKGSRAFTLFSN